MPSGSGSALLLGPATTRTRSGGRRAGSVLQDQAAERGSTRRSVVGAGASHPGG